ncbi:hypothetical protein B0H66DRAFT_369520 [Apodospora peruviana]|uniref:NmrA-like domain-containing protein n=1 Tax=Apodospora peruviana TaxID=516989 RepID=A0AAE0HWS0_9PEZI|nr:hypothetical protein B0H66DRAFT_369520 [Apodospora peruviana]
MSSNTVKTVALVGANSGLGSAILRALLQAGFRITVLRRASSKSPPFPADVHIPKSQEIEVKSLSDAWTTEELTDALRGQDAVVVCFPSKDVNEHLRIADAAAATGTVRRYIPADFGSVDARSPRSRELVPLFGKKVAVRERLEQFAAQNEAFTWTSLVCGHLFDWGLRNGFLHFYPDERRADILGSGNEKSSLSTMAKVAEAVVAVLNKFEETKNRVLMMQSFCVSQLEVLGALRRVLRDDGHGKEWQVDYVGLEEFIDQHKRLADQGDAESIEDLVFALGVEDGNWETKEDFAMELLGLKEDDLDAEVKKALGL